MALQPKLQPTFWPFNNTKVDLFVFLETDFGSSPILKKANATRYGLRRNGVSARYGTDLKAMVFDEKSSSNSRLGQNKNPTKTSVPQVPRWGSVWSTIGAG